MYLDIAAAAVAGPLSAIKQFGVQQRAGHGCWCCVLPVCTVTQPEVGHWLITVVYCGPGSELADQGPEFGAITDVYGFFDPVDDVLKTIV